MIDRKFIYYLSIFLIWLFTVSGITGILSPEHTNWFLSFTPINLMLTFAFIIVNIKKFTSKIWLAFAIPFVFGFVAEALGVNYGLIFGSYEYGDNLGYKVFGVPIMICINWAILTAATSDIAKSISRNLIITSIIGAALMTGLDIIIEVSAPRFDFWEFESGIVPIQNYLGWFCTAFFAHLLYQKVNIETNRTISWHVFISILIFFSAFLFF